MSEAIQIGEFTLRVGEDYRVTCDQRPMWHYVCATPSEAQALVRGFILGMEGFD